MILITSTGEFLLYFTVICFSFISLRKKKKICCRIVFFFFVVLCCPVFAAGIHVPMGLNCDQMEHLGGEHYSEYLVERNPRAYMSMRDYRNLP